MWFGRWTEIQRFSEVNFWWEEKRPNPLLLDWWSSLFTFVDCRWQQTPKSRCGLIWRFSYCVLITHHQIELPDGRVLANNKTKSHLRGQFPSLSRLGAENCVENGPHRTSPRGYTLYPIPLPIVSCICTLSFILRKIFLSFFLVRLLVHNALGRNHSDGRRLVECPAAPVLQGCSYSYCFS